MTRCRDTRLMNERVSARRGSLMLACVALIPFAIFFYLLALTRLEVALGETKRHQQRVQARLLAESALAVARSKRLPDERATLALDGFRGSIAGVGDYVIEKAANTGGATLVFKAKGRAGVRQGSVLLNVHSEIDAALAKPAVSGPAQFVLYDITYRIDAPAKVR